jgi:outer membrane protein OmpA-like peptidoglycan-associated protein
MRKLLPCAALLLLCFAAQKSVLAQNDQATQVSNTDAAPVLKVYQNYDFVPGDKILFEDNFVGDQDGEFPSHWELTNGQAVLNKINAIPALFLTDGNYAVVKPRFKTAKYLTDPFTIEFDYYHQPGAYGIITQLQYASADCGGCETSANVKVDENEVSFEGGSVNLSKTYTEGLEGENFDNKWHHVAMALKNHQLKVYVDQNRVLVVPDTKADFYSVSFAGIGDEKQPIVFKNVRVASGGGMNMLGKKFTDAKLVTHGINFDIDKATIKPESMGTLNMVVQIMKENPDIKFEIDGHTDNTGTAQRNLSLSQQRAEAVKAQLVSMGVEASRLSAKGFGDSKPISDNTTLEGRANNRRVEFVKM